MKSHVSEREVATPGDDFCLRKEDFKTLIEILSWDKTPEEQIEYLTDDCFGINEAHIHQEDNKYDKWNSPDNIDYGLGELMSGCPNLPVYTVRAIFKWLQREFKDEPYTDSYRLLTYRYCQALKQENLTQEEFLINYQWLLDSPFYASTGFGYKSNMLKIFVENHNCPEEEILKACHHEDAWIRQAAISNPKCPIQGRVIVALNGGGTTPEDPYGINK